MIGNLPVLAAAVDRMLTDTGEIGHEETGVDPDTGLEGPIFVASYSGPMLLRPEAVTVVSVGGTEHPRQRFDVTLPAGTEPTIGDKINVTDSADPLLVGASLTLTDVSLDSWQLARFCKAERSP